MTSPVPAAPVDFADWVAPSLLAMSRLAMRLAPPDEAEDVAQDALTRAWQKRATFDPRRGTATTWLLAIVADRARASRRSRVRRLRLVDDAAEIPERTSSDTRTDPDLERAVATLSERQQLAVHLHYFVGLSVDETAAVMSCSPGTAA